MKAKRNYFTVAVCTVYIAAVLAFAASLIFEYSGGTKRAQERFTSLTKDLSRNLKENNTGSAEFSRAILESLGNVSDIAAIQVSSDGKLLFSYPVSIDENKTASSPLIKQLSTSVKGGENSAVLTAALYTLKPSSIYYKGRVAFLVILAATLAAALNLIIVSKKDTDGDGQEDTDAEKDGAEDYFFEEEMPDYEKVARKETDAKDDATVYGNDAEEEAAVTERTDAEESAVTRNDVAEVAAVAEVTAAEDTAVSEVTAGNNAVAEENSYGTEIDSDKTLDFEDQTDIEETIPSVQEKEPVLENGQNAGEEEGAAAEDASFAEEIHEEPSLAENNVAPVGLFDEKTGFGWEQYMPTRLDSELIRAASSEQDLALFTVRIPGIDWTTPEGKETASIIKDWVKFNDLVFDYGSDGFTAIFQNQNTDAALAEAEKTHTEIVSVLKRANSSAETPFVGISTRSLRLISGKRLFNESEQALFHAMEDKDSPIVAFRVNPDKYRSYLAGEASKLKERTQDSGESVVTLD
ncbi:hypothetical protein [uncultured Treponema sp.]|uniref:hypothetical protein n=1 Tax=uncultured Treponema sp. TaxID=162155 RepID=UPI0027D9CAAF|nr:hypothetical protein [uncultured Treponema sp.]